jgi:multiple sugar transport system substrate-binding protein
VPVGIALPTTAGDNFTQQVFGAFALSNGCQMVGPRGEVTIDSAQCASALSYYTRLARLGAPGVQDVDSVRRAYLAGETGMVVWSTFLLDELAGLRDNVAPTCPPCREDPGFLARNTGVVPLIHGPLGTAPGQFGEINSWAILTDANRAPSIRFVEWMMTDGYFDWLAFAPEGKYPVRLGPLPGSNAYVEAWRQMPVGVDRKAVLHEIYPPEVLAAVENGLLTMNQWQGDLVGASLGELPVAQAVFESTVGGADPRGALRTAATELREIQSTLPRGPR